MTIFSVNNNPKISVVMSCYNSRQWLHETIESVLSQTFKDFEFMIVNDGSTDDTWDIIQRYGNQDKRILSISKSHTGLTDSLNVGLAQAKGKWIARIDADDLCEQNRLEEQINFMLDNPEIVLVGSGFIEIDEHGQSIKKHLYPLNHRKLICNLEHRMGKCFPHSSAFFKREIAQKIGYYNKFFQKTQDWDLWLRLAEKGLIASLDSYLVKIRKHAKQISQSKNFMPQILYGIAASICHFLRKNDFQDPSNCNQEKTWNEFISWVNLKIIEAGVLEKQKVWENARKEYLSAENSLIGAVCLGIYLLQSDYASALAWEKLFGSSLPERLAQEWMKRSCVAS